MNALTDLTRPWLALSLLPGVGGATLRAIHASGLWDRTGNSLRAISHELDLGRLTKALETPGALRKAELEADAQVKMAIRYGARIISALDDDFPVLLRASRYNPFLLFVRGTLAPADSKAMAIVGTRKPTESGKALALKLGQEAAENGWSVISGLALGCDAAAHKGALNGAGHTVAVMAHGLHTVEPHRNQDLAKEILGKGGALVSHFAFGVGAEPKYFVQRDAIQSGLAQGVALIQSDINGGSLHAARAALADQRWLWAAPVAHQDQEMGEQEAAAVVRANQILLAGSESEKLDLLRLRDSGPLSLLLAPDAPFPGVKDNTTEQTPAAESDVATPSPSRTP